MLVLERLGHAGGAAVSAQAFDGVDARLSRYSYLVSLLPRQIIDDLGLRHPAGPPPVFLLHALTRRTRAAAFSSTTATPAALPRPSPPLARPPVRRRRSTAFYGNCRKLTEALWPTLLSPLPTRSEARRLARPPGQQRPGTR